jgi:hypothetical protein
VGVEAAAGDLSGKQEGRNIGEDARMVHGSLFPAFLIHFQRSFARTRRTQGADENGEVGVTTKAQRHGDLLGKQEIRNPKKYLRIPSYVFLPSCFPNSPFRIICSDDSSLILPASFCILPSC